MDVSFNHDSRLKGRQITETVRRRDDNLET